MNSADLGAGGSDISLGAKHADPSFWEMVNPLDVGVSVIVGTERLPLLDESIGLGCEYGPTVHTGMSVSVENYPTVPR